MGDSKNQDSDDWQPATSSPGEMYTPEGQIRSARNFALGLVNKDPRRKAYRRPMQRIALLCLAIGAAVVAITMLAQALF